MIELITAVVIAAGVGFIVGTDYKQPQYKCDRCGVFNRDEHAKTLSCYRCGHESPGHTWGDAE
jgi:ribosomal protein S27AE